MVPSPLRPSWAQCRRVANRRSARDGEGSHGPLVGLVTPGLPALIRWRPHHQAIQSLRHPDLAGEARIRAHVEGEVQLILLLFAARTGLVEPDLIHIHHARRAAAGTPAFGDDAGHAPLERALHHRGADVCLDSMGGAIVLNVGDLWHGLTGSILPSA